MHRKITVMVMLTMNQGLRGTNFLHLMFYGFSGGVHPIIVRLLHWIIDSRFGTLICTIKRVTCIALALE